MPNDYIPRNWAEYRAWLLNLKTQVAKLGASFGLTPEEIGAVEGLCEEEMRLIGALKAAEDAYNAALSDARGGKVTTDAALRVAAGKWKFAPGWTEGTAAALRVTSTMVAFYAESFKCEFTVKVVAGKIRIAWKKRGVDGVNVYARLRGESKWTLLGMDTRSPYIDDRPLAQAGVPETREYMLRGLVKDVEVGLESDIVSVTWGGN